MKNLSKYLYISIAILCGVSFLYQVKYEFSGIYATIFCVLSILVFRYLKKDGINTLCERYKSSSWIKRILFCALCMWTSFCLCGNYLFLYPNNKTVSIKDFLAYIIITLWVLPLLHFFYDIVDKIVTLTKDNSIGENKNRRHPGFIIFLWTMIVVAVYLIAYNPAVMSMDSYLQLSQALEKAPLYDWHPALSTLIIRFLYNIVPSPSFLILVQASCAGWLYSSWAKYFYEKGLNYKWTLICVGAFIAIPTNAIHLVTLWKDIPHTLALLWMSLIIAKYFDRKKHKLIFLQIFICQILIFFYRKPGVVPFFICMLVFLIDSIFYKPMLKKVLICTFACIATVMLIKGPVYSALNVDKMTNGGQYIGLGNDIVGTYYYGGNLSKSALDITAQLINQNSFLYPDSYGNGGKQEEIHFSPYWSYLHNNLNRSYSEFILAYIDTFIKNPILMSKMILCRVDLAWGFFDGKGCMVGGMYLCGDHSALSVDYNIAINERKVYADEAFLTLLGIATTKSPLHELFWRTGIWSWFILVASVYMLLKKETLPILSISPLVAYVVSLILSCAWLDYRYYWIVFVGGYFILWNFFIHLVNTKKQIN